MSRQIKSDIFGEVIKIKQEDINLLDICSSVKTHLEVNEYNKSFSLICLAMQQYPHKPHPHNLMGILMEVTGDSSKAIKHFKAAIALDSSYTPSRINLERYERLFYRDAFVFDEDDCVNNNFSVQPLLNNEYTNKFKVKF